MGALKKGLHQILPSSLMTKLVPMYIYTDNHTRKNTLFRLARTVILNGSQWRTRSACEVALHIFMLGQNQSI